MFFPQIEPSQLSTVVMIRSKYIDLNRKFYKLPKVEQTDEFEREFESTIPQFERGISWDELIRDSRVIILSEAGSGKSSEIFNTAKKLRNTNRTAFFVRIEDIGDDIGFEVGTISEFNQWINGEDNAWIFLDSVDEAKLSDPRDFGKAIRKFSRMIATALDRAFIFITSRASSWSYKSDLALCNQCLPKDRDEEYDFAKECFNVYSLTDLDSDQVKEFLVANDVPDRERFLSETYRQEARMFTSRPQDLLELISYWKRHRSIGSKYQLIQDSIEWRLEEQHETYAQINPISKDQVRSGAEKIAVAMILTKKFTARVPDGSNHSTGIDIKSVLPNWDNKECTTLLSRPIFDDAIYGSVRFHHRSVREYLAARWFFNRLNDGSPRFPVENLFFKSQYGVDVIVPSMRHILPWLAQMDEKIRQRVVGIDPHAILEGGDPAMFPCHVREVLFEKVCSSIHNKGSNWHFDHWESVKRMAKPDVSEKINQLLNRYSSDSTIAALLIDSALSGEVKDCLAAASLIATNTDLDDHARISAIKLIRHFDESRLNNIRNFYVTEKLVVGRSLAKELIVGLPRNKSNLYWLMQILESISNVDDYRVTGLTSQLIEFSHTLDLSLSADFGKEIRKLLSQEPFIESGYCKISQKNAWLFDVSLAIIHRLLISRSHLIFQSEFVDVLMLVYPSRHYDIIKHEHKLTQLINEWIEFKHYLFWQGLEQERKRLGKQEVNFRFYYHTQFIENELRFLQVDFPLLLERINTGGIKENRAIALHFCLSMYKDFKKPRNLLNSIKRAVGDDVELTDIISGFLHPPKLSKEDRGLIAKDRAYKGRRVARDREQARTLKEVTRKVKANPSQLRDSGLGRGVISQYQYYFYEKTQSKNNNEVNHWIKTDWRLLIPLVGDEAAFAYRDGIMSFWRQHEPTWSTDSGKIELNHYLFFALAGLQIEADEIESWSDKLNSEEIVLACKYAFANLNEFPNWFANILRSDPALVKDLILKEIKRESSLDTESTMIISKIFYHHRDLWNMLGDELMVLLQENNINVNDVGHAIRIIESLDNISDKDLADLALYKCNSLTDVDILAIWYATWIGADPDPAITALNEHLRSFEIEKDAQDFAMRVISSLMGTKGNGGPARQNFKNPKSLKELIFMTYTHIRREDDLERAGKGIYSPGLRDEAQDARNRLETFLKDIPGKESFSAMVELSRTHPHIPYRKWMMSDAMERARIDSAFGPYSESDFIDFCNTLERTPSNHRELFELAVLRLLDLKADLEDGDNSYALNLINEHRETRVRNVIGGWCRDKSSGRYSVVQEEELADAKKPDLRFLGNTFDAPVPVELKLANKWSIEALIERLENQLCGDYLRDNRSNNGIYLLVNQSMETWKFGDQVLTFTDLVTFLKSHWNSISGNYSDVNNIEIIGIDLLKRST